MQLWHGQGSPCHNCRRFLSHNSSSIFSSPNLFYRVYFSKLPYVCTVFGRIWSGARRRRTRCLLFSGQHIQNRWQKVRMMLVWTSLMS